MHLFKVDLQCSYNLNSYDSLKLNLSYLIVATIVEGGPDGSMS